MNHSRRTVLVALAFLIAGVPALPRHRVYIGGFFLPPPVYIGYAFGRHGAVDCDVSPEEARVFVDGHERGEADDFDGYPGYLELRPGRHRIEFRAPGHKTLVYKVDAHRGWLFSIDEEMESGDPKDVLVRRSGPPPGYRESRDRHRHDRDQDSVRDRDEYDGDQSADGDRDSLDEDRRDERYEDEDD